VYISGIDGITIEGTSGGGFKLLGSGTSGVALQISGCDNCIIRNLVIDGNAVDFIPLALFGGSGTTVTGNSLTNVGFCVAGIYTEDDTSNIYTRNTVDTTEIHLDGGGAYADGTRGIWIGNDGAPSSAAFISENNLINIGGTAIVFAGTNGQIRNNRGSALSYSGVKVVSFSGATGTTYVESNHLSGVGSRYISGGEVYTDGKTGSTETYVIRYNYVISDDESQRGVYVTGGTFQGVIDNNVFVNTKEGGIVFVTESADGVKIRNNVVDCTVAGTCDAGIALWGDTGRSYTNFTIKHNNLKNADEMGLYLQSNGGTIDNISVDYNIFSSNVNYGIQIQNISGTLTDVTISGNCFVGNGASLYDSRGIISPPSQSSECHWKNTSHRQVAIF